MYNNHIDRDNIRIFDISPGKQSFSEKVCNILGIQRSNVTIKKFKDDYPNIDIEDSVRGKDVFVFCDYVPPHGERFLELCLFIDAACKGGHAARVIVVQPTYFGSRGERRTKARQCVPALVNPACFQSLGAWGILTAGIHTMAIGSMCNAVDFHFENLELEYLAAEYIMSNHEDSNFAIGSPDAGGATRAAKLRRIIKEQSGLEPALVMCHKERKKANEVEDFILIGDVEGMDIFWVDDIGDTLGTIQHAFAEANRQGARNNHAILYHPVLGRGFEDNLKSIMNINNTTLIFGNTIPLKNIPLEFQPRIKQLHLEPFFAEAIKRMHKNISISGLHKYKVITTVYKRNGHLKEPEAGKENIIY